MRPVLRSVLAAGVAATVAAGCTPERGESPDAATTSPPVPVSEVTIPPERRTPFCAIMIDLDLSLPADPTVDVTDQVLEAYRRALPVAPPEIAVELQAVIIGLETGTDPSLPPTSSEPAGASSIATTEPDVTTDAGGTTDASPDTAADDFAEEGYVPDDSPEVRLNDFVDFTCRDNVNNPGPPATPPHVEPPVSDPP